MARDSVVKTEILCHDARKSSVLSILEKTGRIHLIDMSSLEDFPLCAAGEEESSQLAGLHSALDKAIGFLKDHRNEKRALDTPVLTVEQLGELLSEEEIRQAVFRCAEISDELAELKSGEQDLDRQINFLDQWQDLPMPLEMINREGMFSLRAGKVSPREGFDPLESLAEKHQLFHFKKLSETRALALWHTEIEGTILSELTEAGFAAEDFSNYTGDASSELEILKSKLDETHERIQQLHRETESLMGMLPELQSLYDAEGLESFKSASMASGRRSESSLLLHAWVRKSDIPSLRESLESLGEVDLAEIEPEDGETPPVFLSESASADPYLMLTDMYGRPQGSDPDPTPHMAPFYAMFFGVCIGDAGYGLALAAGAAAGWYFTAKRQGNTRLFRLLFQGGIASIFWGVLLGGWFGMSFDLLPSFLQAAAMPLNNLVPGYTRGGDGFSLSNQFLYLTLGFGLVQLAWGIIVNLKKRLRAGEGFAAIVDQTGWMLALLGLFPWLFNHYLLDGALYPTPGVMDSVFLAMLGAGALLIFIMGGMESKGIGGKVGLGAYACYGIVNLLGDVLSYSRLFALALSSAIIASVINQIAGMLSGAIPVLGFVLAVLVLAGGHLFNLAMAVLSGFIHTARLQFVEFFGKFYDGTGVPFTPMRYEPRYVRIDR